VGSAFNAPGLSAARLDPTGRTRRLAVFTARLFALFVLVWLGLGTMTSAPRTEPFGVLVADGRPERLVDFASHRSFACAAWSGDLAREGGTSIYTLDAHLKATARWTGLPAEIALPFGYSPTMLWVLGPLCALPGRSAYVAWSLVSILATGWLILRVRAHWMVPLVLVTPLTLCVFALGQTALLTTAGLFFLMTSETEGEAARSPGSWSRSVVLWLITAKPPLALAASVALLAGGRGRIVLRAAALTLVSTLALTPWLGGGWVRDYLHLLGSYDRVRLPAAFAWSITPRLMSNLRAALHSDLGLADDLAVRLSTVAWGAGLAGVALAAWRRRIPAGPVWALCILAYLLLCPHVSLTEDVALFCVLVGVEGARLPGVFRLGAVLLALIGLLLNPAIGPVSGHRPSVLFFAKLVLLAYVLAAAHREAAATPAPAPRRP
jgi:hypothetical protein